MARTKAHASTPVAGQKKAAGVKGVKVPKVRLPHRWSRGTASRLKAARQIKNHNKYLLPKETFIRMIRHLIEDDQMRVTEGFWRGLRHVVSRQLERIIDGASRRMRLSKLKMLSEAYLLDAFDDWCSFQPGDFKGEYQKQRHTDHHEDPVVPDLSRVPFGKLIFEWHRSVHNPRNYKSKMAVAA